MEKNAVTVIREILYAHQDPKYAEFVAKLIPTLPKECFIGVRSPEYKKIVKELPGEEILSEFISTLPHEYYEENILQNVLIGRNASTRWKHFCLMWITGLSATVCSRLFSKSTPRSSKRRYPNGSLLKRYIPDGLVCTC